MRLRYPVHWIETMHDGHYLMMAICGRTQEAITLANRHPMTDDRLFLLRNFFIDEEGKCEEADRCFNTACELNHTTPESLCKSLGTEVPEWLQGRPIKPLVLDATLRAEITRLCRDYPQRSIVLVSHDEQPAER